MRYPLIALIGIMLIAGCVGQTTQPSTQIEAADVITAASQAPVPANPAAGSDFTASFTITNQHKDRIAKAVGAWIFDTGRCTLNRIGDKSVDAVSYFYDTNKVWPAFTFLDEPYRTDFAPGQTEVVRLSLTAPGSAAIAGLPSTCPIRYKVDYNFTAQSEMSVDVISTGRLNQIETQTGARPVTQRTLFVGGGPIRVLLEPTTTLPVETSTADVPKKLSFTLTITNEGAGEFPVVEKYGLSIKVPAEFGVPTELGGKPCGDFFDFQAGGGINSRPIELIQKSSNPITCTFTTPGTDVVPIQRQFTIFTSMPYKYDYFGPEISVPITP
jgi:hypothetical protein